MALYLNKKNDDLKKSILYPSDIGEFNHIIIITGYVGLGPINELSKLGINSTVVFGM